MIASCNKDQLSLTNPRNALHHWERAANNVDAQCDKLAIELSWQRFASKVAKLQLPHLHLTYIPHLHLAPPLRATPFEFCLDFRHQKARIPAGAIVSRCVILRLAVSVQRGLVTDGQTDTLRQ